MTDPVLVVEGLTATFEGPRGELHALGGVSFRAAWGEFLCVVGPSGCGKSTLLRLLAGLAHPTSGAVHLHGERVTAPNRQVGMVFQEPTLMDWRTVRGNVMLPLEIEGVPQEKARRQADALIQLVGLTGFEEEYPRNLSGGMAQRVAIARALVYDPQVLLLDEPFGALDALTRERMGLELLRIWGAQRKTVVMVTHSVEEAVFLADRVLVLSYRPGRIVAEVPIPLPRPRELELLGRAEFAALTGRVREALTLDHCAGETVEL